MLSAKMAAILSREICVNGSEEILKNMGKNNHINDLELTLLPHQNKRKKHQPILYIL